MKAIKYALLSTVVFASFANAGTVSDFFDGVSVGAGYANESYSGEHPTGDAIPVDSKRSDGLDIYAQAPINDYLFVDSRYSWTQEDYYGNTKAGNQLNAESKFERYQAYLGAGYPFHVTQSIQLKPFVKTGWSWDKGSLKTVAPTFDTQVNASKNDNSFTLGTGVEAQFGHHFVSTVNYTKETSGFKMEQVSFDLGYRF
ncbi:hypothetical protein JCM19232_2556 [Vibrio ishigakensis]|uniref:Outer membrane protein beta-barrel domain-containing protein n=1 Tax=Vibrio ishigakensis TaxID=1481914 RepID=A0A0B8PB15_9VIBR|nr:hypothetical protein JCM19232_2556 [Vibrio ishigakensis]GAM70152.1 hypothetical protein JCM19236_5699 [Vibrio sp. JCM 19236]